MVAALERCDGLPFFFAVAVALVGGAMAEEKEESGTTQADGTSPVVEKAEKVKAVRGVVLFYREADKQLGENGSAGKIMESLIGLAVKGDISAIKLVADFADRAGRAEEITDEEMETLGTLLMREFHALQAEEKNE